MASQDVSGKTSRLAQIQMRFQQRQEQEKEQRRLELAGNRRETETDTARSTLTTAKTSNIGNGKVRQMFDERRRGAGIDRSNPLKPIAPSSKSISTPTLVQKSSSRVQGVRSQEAVAAQAAKTVRKTVSNKKAYQNRSTHSLLTPDNKRERNNNDTTSSINGLDDIDNETMPRGFYTDGDAINNDSNNNTKKKIYNGKSSNNTSHIKLNPVLTKKSPPVRTTSTRLVSSPQTPPSRKSTGSMQAMKLETTSSAKSINKTPSVAKGQSPSARKQEAAATTPRTPSASKGPPPEGMVACKFCGRNFNDDRISKHEEVCQKMANSKRKVFDASKHRIKGTEAEQFHKRKPPGSRTPAAERGTVYISAAAASGQTIAPKKSSWRRKHEEFIEAIRAAKQVQAHLARGGKLSDLPPPPPSENPDYIQCPHCHRRFNQSAAERHIPKCATMLHNKPKPPNANHSRK